jgi:hypothetical protein
MGYKERTFMGTPAGRRCGPVCIDVGSAGGDDGWGSARRELFLADGSKNKSRFFDSAEVRFAQDDSVGGEAKDDSLVLTADLGFLIASNEAFWRFSA